MHSIVDANTRRLTELVPKLRPNINTLRLDENLRFGKNIHEDPLSERQIKVIQLVMWLQIRQYIMISFHEFRIPQSRVKSMAMIRRFPKIQTNHKRPLSSPKADVSSKKRNVILIPTRNMTQSWIISFVKPVRMVWHLASILSERTLSSLVSNIL